MRYRIPILLLCLLAWAAPAWAQDEPPTIATLASDTEDLALLVAALEDTDLIDMLDGDGPFTVFAPVNAAFEVAPPDLLAPAPGHDSLVNILTYHVVEGRIAAEDLAALETIPTLQGAPVSVQTTEDGLTLNGRAQILTADIQAANGIVHLIDTVLVPGRPGAVAGPESLLDTIMAGEDYAFLNTALEIASGARAVLAAPTAPVTLFAPSAETFNNLADDERRALVGDEALLTSTLLYHMLTEAYTSNALLELLAEDSPQDFDTQLPGASVTLSLGEGGTILVNDVPVIVADDGAGGVLHVIDGLLTPPDDAILDEAALAALRPVAEADVPGPVDEGPALDENWDAVAGGFGMDELDTADDFFQTVIDPFAEDPDAAELYGIEIINWTAAYRYTGFIVENYLTAETLIWMNEQDPTTFELISQTTLDRMPEAERAQLPDDLPRE
ncbi:MAG: fasciclin domain-containing protein [Anaerolineales bacterium]